MLQIRLKDIEKSYGEQDLFKHLDLTIEYGDRIGIVGANGAGKTTLLKILTGELTVDDGEIYRRKELVVQMLKQVDQADHAVEFLENIDFLYYLSLLGVDQELLTRDGDLSGGEQTKIAVARVLANQPDILILDEPTNHLDYEGKKMLAYILNEYEGTVIMVSHDRYFLDQTVKQVFEINAHQCKLYEGNYSDYREEKELLLAQQQHRYEEDQRRIDKIEKDIDHIQRWSTKAHQNSRKMDKSGLHGMKEKHRARAKKMDKKVKSTINRLEKFKDQMEERPVTEKVISFEFDQGKSYGKRIIMGEAVSKRYGEQTIIEASDFFILKGEKMALFGENGSGKTTLVKMITGESEVSSGTLWKSESCKPFVFHQDFEDMQLDCNVLKYLSDRLGTLSGENRTLLNNMGITANDLQKKVDCLSYGEKVKLKLAEAILLKRDFMILDEPTNHVDIHIKESLEKTLQLYEGTLIVISHDIYFLQKICNKVLYIEDKCLKRSEESFANFFSK